MMTRNKAGMILFVLSEAVFFGLLVLAYAFYHREGQASAAAKMLDPIKTGFFSIALFSSSYTMWVAEQHRKRNNSRGVTLWLLATIVLGLIFLIGQGTEYAGLLRHNVTISRDLFGTTFFTLTGFHGLHVFVGLLMLGILLALAVFGRDWEPTDEAMGIIAIYWHFVDAVWVVIFGMVYLWGLFA